MPPNKPDDLWKVDASPTKSLFISIIVRDIELSRAIADLVDNSVDGATRQRKKRLDEYYVRIDFDRKHFLVTDNCAGIDTDIARKVAFRLGRPEGAPPTHHSIGEFGIGMKRALFKIGKYFRITSTTDNTRFVIEQDVEQWAKQPGWELKFSELQEGKRQKDVGTTIEITKLHGPVADEFALDNFKIRLREQLMSAYEQLLARGLIITLNGLPLQLEESDLLESDDLTPAHELLTLESESGKPVRAQILAGVSQGKPADAGWNIYCNGRLILDADKSWTTGWGTADGFPHYHNQYSRFRGFVFFDSDEAKALPWNTTKSALDVESAVYQTVRERMIEISKPIVTFLNKLKEEKSQQNDSSLERQLSKAKKVSVSKLATRNSDQKKSQAFKSKQPASRKPKVDQATITYTKPKRQVELVKEALGVRTNAEVGEETFDYYFRMECE